jgi:oxygen-independent coproporphyrinogen III oxidase
MAGIYIHIPFCKQPCSYCNFYFSTSQHFKADFLKYLEKEIEMQQDYLENEEINTIYFGGGTPSILSAKEISTILEKINKHFKVNHESEITLEANPDDLTKEKISTLKTSGVNRLSIGVQSFFEEDLKLMNRAHSAYEAESCIKLAQDSGIENISIDLIYGTPGLSNEAWKKNLDYSEKYNVKHLSCYALTIEENTPLFHQIRKKQIAHPDDAMAAKHFQILMDFAETNNWWHYEISNFCKDGYISKHNSSYWQGKKYLGLGPSAHSYNAVSRQWNIAGLKKYIDYLEVGKLNFEIEVLDKNQRWNEYIMIGLRTSWGLDRHYLKANFPEFIEQFSRLISQSNPDFFSISDEKICLSKSGMFYADKIASDFFV